MEEKQKLLNVLQDINPDINYESELNMVDDGLIDSLEITVLIVALNDAFNIRIQNKDIEPENFNSLAGILNTIRKYKKEHDT